MRTGDTGQSHTGEAETKNFFIIRVVIYFLNLIINYQMIIALMLWLEIIWAYEVIPLLHYVSICKCTQREVVEL